MKTPYRTLALAVMAAWLCSCASTSVQETWKAPNSPAPAHKLAVLAISQDEWTRQAIEGYLAEELKKKGVHAITTFNLLTLNAIKEDKPAAAARFTAGGEDALLIVRLVANDASIHHLKAGDGSAAAAMAGSASLGWYDYYDMALLTMASSYATLEQVVLLESTLYNFKTEKPFWSALTKTVIGYNTDRLAEADLVAKKVVAAMRADKVIQ